MEPVTGPPALLTRPPITTKCGSARAASLWGLPTSGGRGGVATWALPSGRALPPRNTVPLNYLGGRLAVLSHNHDHEKCETA